MDHETIIRPDKDLADLAERAVSGERIVIELPSGARVEMRAVAGADSGPLPDVTAEDDLHGLKWLAAHRVGTKTPSLNAIELVRQLRDEGP